MGWYHPLLKNACKLGKLETIQYYCDNYDTTVITPGVWKAAFDKLLPNPKASDAFLLDLYEKAEYPSGLAANLIYHGRYSLLKVFVNRGWTFGFIEPYNVFHDLLTQEALDFITEHMTAPDWDNEIVLYLDQCNIDLIPYIINRFSISKSELYEHISYCVGSQPCAAHNHYTTQFLLQYNLDKKPWDLPWHIIDPKKACLECLMWYNSHYPYTRNQCTRVFNISCYRNDRVTAAQLLRTMNRDEGWLEDRLDSISSDGELSHSPAITAMLRRELDLAPYTRGMASLMHKLPLDHDSDSIVLDFLCFPYMHKI